VASEGTRQWPPQQLTYVAMVAIAVFAAYATGVSILLSAAAHGLVHAVAESKHAEEAHRADVGAGGGEAQHASSEERGTPSSTPI